MRDNYTAAPIIAANNTNIQINPAANTSPVPTQIYYPLSEWTTAEVRGKISCLGPGYSKYAEILFNLGVDGAELLVICADQLEALVPSEEHRKGILDFLAYQKRYMRNSSSTTVSTSSPLSPETTPLQPVLSTPPQTLATVTQPPANTILSMFRESQKADAAKLEAERAAAIADSAKAKALEKTIKGTTSPAAVASTTAASPFK